MNLTHTVTHTGKRAGGDNGEKRSGDLILPGQKRPKRLANQRLEGFQAVGKDEVPSSNLGSSSKNA